MNMIHALARAFGIDPAVLERLVAAYENPDRLALIESRWQEQGCPDGDKAWLIAEVKRLRVIAPAGHPAAIACGDEISP